MSHDRHRPVRTGGFSLVELVVTLVILGILAALATPVFNKSETDAAWFQEQVRAAVRYAQKVAIAQRRTVFVKVSPTKLEVCYDAGCASPVLALTTNAAYTIDAPSTVTLTSTVTPFTFNALGQASTAVTLNASGRTVTVTAETGYVQ